MNNYLQLDIDPSKAKVYPDGSIVGRKNFAVATGLPAWATEIVLEEDDFVIDVFDWIDATMGGDNPTGRGLLLWGGPGPGKTTAAVAAASEFYNEGKRVYYLRARDFVQMYIRRISLEKRMQSDEESYIEEWETLTEIMARMVGDNRRDPYDLLVLDDLGKENGTANTREEMDHIIRARADLCVPTIVTTNLDPSDTEQMDRRYVTGFGSFLRQAFDVLHHNGPDRRG